MEAPPRSQSAQRRRRQVTADQIKKKNNRRINMDNYSAYTKGLYKSIDQLNSHRALSA